MSLRRTRMTLHTSAFLPIAAASSVALLTGCVDAPAGRVRRGLRLLRCSPRCFGAVSGRGTGSNDGDESTRTRSSGRSRTLPNPATSSLSPAPHTSAPPTHCCISRYTDPARDAEREESLQIPAHASRAYLDAVLRGQGDELEKHTRRAGNTGTEMSPQSRVATTRLPLRSTTIPPVARPTTSVSTVSHNRARRCVARRSSRSRRGVRVSHHLQGHKHSPSAAPRSAR